MEVNNENRPVAIQVSGVKKMYKLGQIGGGTLQADLQSWWAKVRGKEDPNTKIGEEERSKGDTFMALNGIDLTIYQGEAVGIIGKNGAGKSTLLKLLTQVTAPTKGEIDIYGRVASMLEVGTGFNPELTGRENVYMNGAILGMTKAEIDAKMEDIIEFSEVREFIDTPVKRYSSGMYVKLAFSVAAHLDSEIMIMDEVLAVGDMAFQKKCLTKMREAAKQDGRTVLYVSHNMNTIRQLCDRCIVLDMGKVLFDGNTNDGISIYQGSQDSDKLLFDYSNYKQNPNEIKTCEFKSIVFNSETSKVTKGDILSVRVNCFAKKAVANIGVRLEIYASDGYVIGTTFSKDKLDIKNNGEFSFDLGIKTKNICPGKYKCIAVLYEQDNYGNQVGIHSVDPALFFEIIQPKNNDLVWLKQWWGHVELDSLILDYKE